jgi:HEAT repeat protein
MSEKHDIRQGDHQQGPDPADARVLDALKTQILAHLGLLPEMPEGSQSSIPAWQKQVIDVQKLAEMCNTANVRQTVEALEEELGQQQNAVRMAVIRALGKIYLSFPGHVRWELFMRGLADQSPEVRATTVQVFMACITAANPRPPHGQVVERLAKKLSQLGSDGRASEDESVNISVIQLMGLLGDQAPDTAVAAIVYIACNTREDWPVREAAILVLGSLYHRLSAEQCLQASETLYDAHPFVRRVAIHALQKWVTVAEVREVLRTGGTQRQVYAAQVLGQWGEHDALCEIAFAQKEASSMRTAALLSLAQLARTQDILIKSSDLERLINERDLSLKAVKMAAEMLKEARQARHRQIEREEGAG